MIAPDVFVPIAEETGLIVSIGEWALRGACLCNRAWREEGMDRLRVAVNVSSRQLADEGLAGTLRQILAETGMPAHNLGLELTESMAMSADEATLRALHGLRSLGARLSIDDFGTGYSSLAYLKHFPVDSLKIDRSFVRDLTRNPDDAAIVQAIVAMAHGLGLFAVAEGVERREQLEFLAGHGCDAAQGTYFSEPVPADGVPKLLRDWEREER
jgi:EAL domain-containing protein (putative c-di-GMP-specific phosphodiesterase class I)